MSAQRQKDLAIWRSLSQAQKKAMDSAAQAPLYKQRHGWQNQSVGLAGHAANTIDALVKRGLLAHQAPNCVRITRKGSDVFGSVGEKL
jgi:hypothetical protein